MGSKKTLTRQEAASTLGEGVTVEHINLIIDEGIVQIIDNDRDKVDVESLSRYLSDKVRKLERYMQSLQARN